MLLDKRTTQRILDRGVAMGKMQHYSIYVPTSRTGKEATAIAVVLKPGLELEGNAALIRKVGHFSVAVFSWICSSPVRRIQPDTSTV